MTVLRSREVSSSPKPKQAQTSAPISVVPAPVTPLKTSELPNQSWNQNIGRQGKGCDSVAGSVMVSECGRERRFSARLAKKVVANVEVAGVKRKKVSQDLADGDPDANVVSEVLQDLGDGGFMEALKDSEKIEDSVSAARPEVCCDVVHFPSKIRDSGQCKRRFSMEAKEGRAVCKGDAKIEEGETSSGKKRRFVGSKKSEGQFSYETLAINGFDLVNPDSDDTFRPPLLVESNHVSTKFSESSGSEEVAEDNISVDISASDEVLPDEVQVRGTRRSRGGGARMERFRNFARRNASRFAHFSSQDELDGHANDVAGTHVTPQPSNRVEDWPGPFSTAMKIIKDRESKRNGGRLGASTDKSEAIELKWIPRGNKSCKHQKQAPLLQDICLSILCKNADAITSLNFVPDALRHKISWFLCDSRMMDSNFLELLVHDTPTEIRIRDCSWLSEEQFVKIFENCNTSNLMVLQVDLGGNCMPDYVLYSTLARSPNRLPALTAVSLKGAYRLSDAGISMLVSAAPSLKSIDIGQCPLLTSDAICSLANSLKLVLRELYIDNCHGIDVMLILPSLQILENLEVLSVAGLLTVCDDFVSGLVSVHGSKMKELVLADCMELTDSSLEVIGHSCPNLQAIDLMNLCKLTDISLGHLANGCQSIQSLKLCRNAFSDEAIAAYFDVNGASLKCLSLNNVIQVSTHSALSLARNCKNLRSLDLSWCRNLTNEALGLIVDSCILLEVLKLFGCTQVTDVFVDGHSNLQVKVIGLKMCPIFKHIEFPNFLLGPLQYPSTNF